MSNWLFKSPRRSAESCICYNKYCFLFNNISYLRMFWIFSNTEATGLSFVIDLLPLKLKEKGQWLLHCVLLSQCGTDVGENKRF